MNRESPLTPTAIVPGNYADPSVIRVGCDYYMTHTSYRFIPGLIIWHSRDLYNWRPVTAALHECVGDVWAPDFVHHNGTFYIYFPANRSNWVVTAPSPEGPWSKPIDLQISGIDPGHVVGPDGKRYLHLSDGYIVELSADGLSVAGEPRRVYEGWKYPPEWEVEAYSMEGPKLVRHGGYYHLTVAVGGTAGPPTSHMVVSSRSRTPWGPWEHSPYNPIVHTWSREETWWSKGHGSLIDTPEGDWYIVYHAYLNGFATLGRQTLLEPIEWTEDGWFKLAEKRSDAQSAPDRTASAGDAPFEDDFAGERLKLCWQACASPPEERFRLSGGALLADGSSDGEARSPLLYMPAHRSYEAQIEVSAEGDAEGRLLLYYNDSAWLGIGASRKGVRHVRSFKTYAAVSIEGGRVWLRIRNDRHIVSFFFSTDGIEWRKYDKVVEASGFHHNTLGGFLSLRIGLDAVGKGTVAFRGFRYTPIG